jgi:hypothetical protein
MHRLMAGPHVAGIDPRGHRLDALPIPRQTEARDVGAHGFMPIPMTEGGGEALHIRVKPLRASVGTVGHTPRLTAYPITSLVFLTQ